MKKINMINSNGIVKVDYLANNIHEYTLTVGDDYVDLELVYDDNGIFIGIVLIDNDAQLTVKLIKNKTHLIPRTLKKLRALQPELKASKVVWAKGTGNSSKNSYSTSLYIPIQWARELGLSADDRNVVIEFDGNEIKIRKRK